MAREVAAAMLQVPMTYELVFVDDASTDTTWQRILEARNSDPRTRGLRHSHNGAQSPAVWPGFCGTQPPLFAPLEGAPKNNPADLPRLIAEIERYDFVCG